MFSTDLGKAINLINSAGAVTPDRIKQARRILKKAAHPRDILKSDLAKLATKLEKERDKQIEYFKKNAEVHGDLMICELKSKYKIKSAVITKLSYGEFQDKTLIILQRSKDSYNISARRQDRRVSTNILLRKATEGLKGANAGGHIPASGGMFRAEDLDIFKKRLIKIHESMVAA